MTTPARAIRRLKWPTPMPHQAAANQAADLLEKCERDVAEVLKRWETNRSDGAIGTILRPLLAELRGE